jgi:hypothetical protein
VALRATKMGERQCGKNDAAADDDAERGEFLDVTKRPVAEEREAHAVPPEIAIPAMGVGGGGGNDADDDGSSREPERGESRAPAGK